jgi:hypothetical protein
MMGCERASRKYKVECSSSLAMVRIKNHRYTFLRLGKECLKIATFLLAEFE